MSGSKQTDSGLNCPKIILISVPILLRSIVLFIQKIRKSNFDPPEIPDSSLR
jgi:hypothetical protein